MMSQREVFAGHKFVLAGIDRAMGNVYDVRYHPEIDKCFVKLRKLATMVLQMKALSINSTDIKFPLPTIVALGENDTNTLKVAMLKRWIRLRDRMEALGISTSSIDRAIAVSFEVVHTQKQYQSSG